MRTFSAMIVGMVSMAAASSVYSAPDPAAAYPAAPSNSPYPVDGYQDWEHQDDDDNYNKHGWEYSAPSYSAPSYSAPSYSVPNKSEEHNTWEHKATTTSNTWEHKETKTNTWEHKETSTSKTWEHKETSTSKTWEPKETKGGYEKATTTTKIVSQYTTYCPEPTVVTVNEKQYTVTKATTLTITDCPCTIVEPCPTETAKPPPPPPKYEDGKHDDGKHDEGKPAPPPPGPPKPPPVIVSGASSSFVHVGAAVFGALVVGVLAL